MRLTSFIITSLTIFLAACNSGNSSNLNNNENQISTKIPTTSSAYINCQQQLFNQTEPSLSANLNNHTYPLCFDGFAVRFSGISRTPIWVSEYLTRQRLTSAKQISREDNFHPELNLPADVRSELYDYKGSGYDRGHLAPNADMPNKNAQYDSFSLANIAPQHPENNQKNWVKIEQKVRSLTNQYGESYVVTGVSFLTPMVKKINNRVLVPSHFFKAVYFPTQNQAIAFITPNDDSQQTDIISLDELKNRVNVDAFPTLPSSVKQNMMNIRF